MALIKPADVMRTIREAAAACQTSAYLNSQQRTFVEFIAKSAQQTDELLQAIPQTDYALSQIMPLLADSLQNPLTVLAGYAKMLLEHPASFGGADLATDDAQQMRLIYEQSVIFKEALEAWTASAQAERQAQHKLPMGNYDLNMIIWQHVPVYRYWIREKAVKLMVNFQQGIPPIKANPYHLNALVQHLIRTLARDLMPYGTIEVNGAYLPASKTVELKISATGIELSPDEMALLFDKQGNDFYWRQAQKQAIRIETSQQVGYGASLHLLWDVGGV